VCVFFLLFLVKLVAVKCEFLSLQRALMQIQEMEMKTLMNETKSRPSPESKQSTEESSPERKSHSGT